ncbi:hypothetical protein [Calothrix sp. PCC 6303]|uniref:hypothetical protein n=1 Tax=Calothrix sp. PCC 6303 TaxID=1170562 RepID=UPI0002A01F17|nr:hypothetical protein [Calothrix sp. PCC 6303]AFZ00356.1 hypothetical protein Cal6303_1296 [Calothrix sp. PCC 6303]
MFKSPFKKFVKSLKDPLNIKGSLKYFAEKNRQELEKLSDDIDDKTKKRINQTLDGLDKLESQALKDINKIFDKKLFPLADELDYIAKQRIEQAIGGLEQLEIKTNNDIILLLRNADEKIKNNLLLVDNIRQETIKDIRTTLETADFYLENRINQISLLVMESICALEKITNNTLKEVNILEDKIFQDLNFAIDKINKDITDLEEKLFQDANLLIDKLIYKMDEVIGGNIELVRNEFKKYLVHSLPNPFDKCRQILKLGMKPGAMLSDIELYELTECYELNKLTENTSIDDVLKTYGQLQLNAARMAYLVRNAPELKRRAIEDWIHYGMLCDFWRNTSQNYGMKENVLSESQLAQNLLSGR